MHLKLKYFCRSNINSDFYHFYYKSHSRLTKKNTYFNGIFIDRGDGYCFHNSRNCVKRTSIISGVAEKLSSFFRLFFSRLFFRPADFLRCLGIYTENEWNGHTSGDIFLPRRWKIFGRKSKNLSTACMYLFEF